MNLPDKYKWVLDVPKPLLLTTGLTYYGVKEIPGRSSNPIILDMAKRLGVSDIYQNDDVAWCALFMFFLCHINGFPHPTGYDVLRAKSFVDYGNPAGQTSIGTILVFERPQGFHVGLEIAKTDKTYHVFGGNESNMVNIVEIEKKRLIASRVVNLSEKSNGYESYTMGTNGLVSKNES